MDERDKRRVGEQVDPGGRPKAPGRLELLQRFINTHNHDFPPDWDRLGTAAKAQAWLREKRLIGPADTVSTDDAARLRELREALRALVVANGRGAQPDPEALRVVREVAGAAPLRVAVGDAGESRLTADGADGTLLAIVHEAQLSGHWPRMKACRHCEYAFYDRSKNRSAAWCAMSICGNRSKNRAYYARRRG